MAVRLVLASLALAAGAKRNKAAGVPLSDCIVTSTAVDGTEERRECFLMADEDLKPGTKGRFESCTQ